MTWADDDRLYTAYGDGNGFEPFVPAKLSLGLARVDGRRRPTSPASTSARRPPSRRGDGNDGQEGQRHADGRRRALPAGPQRRQRAARAGRPTTAGRGRGPTGSSPTSFGCPTFLNFGRNYAGGRDDFVYVYSHDADSAYEPADRMVLARVAEGPDPRARRLRVLRAASTRRASRSGRADIAERGGRVRATRAAATARGISYNAGLKRYLWCQILPGRRPRAFAGGFGIYDAPEPWGPWTTAFFTEDWDVGPGEIGQLPDQVDERRRPDAAPGLLGRRPASPSGGRR